MPHYKNPKTGAVFFYETDGERKKFAPADLIPMTQAETDAFIDAQSPQAESSAPAQCTRRQGLLALLAFGIKRSDIEVQIAAIEDEIEREEAQIEYESAVWERTNPRLQQMWTALGGAPAQLVDVFRLAVTL